MRDGKCCFGILFEIVFDVRKQHNNMIHIKFNQNASNMVVLSVCDQLINKLDVQEVGLTRFSIDVNLEVVRLIPATLLPFYIRWPYQNYVLLSCSEFSRRIYSWPIFRCNVGKRFVVVVVGMAVRHIVDVIAFSRESIGVLNNTCVSLTIFIVEQTCISRIRPGVVCPLSTFHPRISLKQAKK